ncbi:MAG: hypothetical protein KDB23_13430 [Planctomycetales bacterium]|nr:hypothetical protein [Planctomycetales bacterium]
MGRVRSWLASRYRRVAGVESAQYKVARRRRRSFLESLEDRRTLAGDLDVVVDTAPNFIVDSNLKAGPTAAYIAATLTNTGTDTLSDVVAYIGDFTGAGVTGGTPGVYPQETDPSYAGDLSLQHEGGALDAVRYIDTLAPGESVTQYWLVSYPWYDTAGQPTYGAHANNLDDLVLDYDVWAQAVDPIDGPLTTVIAQTATMREEISAMANKIWPNTTSKVPDEYLNAFEEQLGWRPDQVAPAIARTEGVWYDFGRVNQGFDADASLIPDYDSWSQPVGDPSAFDASAWRLMRSYGVLVVKLNDGTEQVIAFENQLYHKDLPANNTGVVGLVFYEFAPIGVGPGQLSPYQEAASGSNNEKFNGDYGTFVGGPTGTPPTATFDKTGPATVAPNTTITYDLTVVNTGTTPFGLNVEGAPAVISDSIPSGTQYVTGTADDNMSLPPGMTALILYSTDNGDSWTTTDTGAATTNLQWWLSEPLDPAESATVHFQTFIPATFTQSQLYNEGGVGLGSTDPIYVDSVNSLVAGTLSISGKIFLDDGGVGGTSGDGLRQAGETTYLTNISVTLYPDLDGDGVLDPDEEAAPRTTTVSAGATGDWSFTNLPDGQYLVQIQADDPDRPTGYVLSTDEVIPVTLSGSSVSGIESGFAPTLDLQKNLLTTGSVLEGTNVTYELSVTNLLKPDGFVAPVSLDGHVFFADTNSTLKYIPPGGGSTTTLISSLSATPTEIAFDEANGTVFLAYASSGLIERRNLDGTGALTIATGQAGVSGIAVDSVHNFVYWASTTSDAIFRKNTDNTGVVTSITGLNNPVGVAVDSLNATIYWIETQGNLLRIRRGGLDFSNPTDLFTPTTIGSGNHNPHDLEIDPLRAKLYWADDKSGTGCVRTHR